MMPALAPVQRRASSLELSSQQFQFSPSLSFWFEGRDTENLFWMGRVRLRINRNTYSQGVRRSWTQEYGPSWTRGHKPNFMPGIIESSYSNKEKNFLFHRGEFRGLSLLIEMESFYLAGSPGFIQKRTTTFSFLFSSLNAHQGSV